MTSKTYSKRTKKWKIEIPTMVLVELLNEVNVHLTSPLIPNHANERNIEEYYKEATLIQLQKQLIRAVTTQKNYLILFRYEAITLSEFESRAKYYLNQIT